MRVWQLVLGAPVRGVGFEFCPFCVCLLRVFWGMCFLLSR